jgi:hypothetical protein
MPGRIKQSVPRKRVLRLPDLDHAKSSVLNSSLLTIFGGPVQSFAT